MLLKGGHLAGNELTDLLALNGQPAGQLAAPLSGPRIPTRNSHGTGCTLSSAIAAQLALGLELAEAVEAAHAYIRGALAAGEREYRPRPRTAQPRLRPAAMRLLQG